MTNASCRGRNDTQLGGTTGKETEGWRESAERGPEVSWNEREAAARSRYVSSAGSPANRSTVGAAGRRRQFRADRRCNHPRPCPPLLSGPSGGLFSLPPCRVVARRAAPHRASFSAPIDLVPSAAATLRGRGGRRVPPVTGRIRRVANSATERVPIGCVCLRSDRCQPRDKQACWLLQLPPLRPSRVRRGRRVARRLWRPVTRAFELHKVTLAPIGYLQGSSFHGSFDLAKYFIHISYFHWLCG